MKEFERKKNNTTLFFLLSKCPQVLKIFYDWPVKFDCEDFDIWLLGSSLVYNIFNKAIISWVLYGYEVEMNIMYKVLVLSTNSGVRMERVGTIIKHCYLIGVQQNWKQYYWMIQNNT